MVIFVTDGMPLFYRGNGLSSTQNGEIVHFNEKKVEELRRLENPELAKKYLNQYRFIDKIGVKLGFLDCYKTERYNVAKATLKEHKKGMKLAREIIKKREDGLSSRV